jgi:hypothetical protein
LDSGGANPRHTRTLRREPGTIRVIQQSVSLDDVALALDRVGGKIRIGGDRSLNADGYTVDTVLAVDPGGTVSASGADSPVGTVLAVDTVSSRGAVDTVAAVGPGWACGSGRACGPDAPRTAATGGCLISDTRWATPTLGAGLMGMRLDRYRLVSAGQIRHGVSSGWKGWGLFGGAAFLRLRRDDTLQGVRAVA